MKVGELEIATLKDLVPHCEAGNIPVDHLDPIAMLIFEYKEEAGQRVEVHGSLYDAPQGIE